MLEVRWDRGPQARLVVAAPQPREVFAKAVSSGPRCLQAEVEGLRWLAEAGAALVVEVVASGPGALATGWVEPGEATAAGAEAFGRALADLHHHQPASFGAPWPGCIGPLPQSNEPAPDWPTFYAGQRLGPACRAAADAGGLPAPAAALVEEVIEAVPRLAGPPEPPSRIHGDLWSGNVLWDVDGAAWLVDPAAHGGHRETDVAMLALFGVPRFDRILAAYREQHPLSDGWRRRVGLHQLHPLLVHAVLFGSSYGPAGRRDRRRTPRSGLSRVGRG